MRLTWCSAKLDHSICCEIGECTPFEMIWKREINFMSKWKNLQGCQQRRGTTTKCKNIETLIVENNKKPYFSWICLVYRRKQRKAKFIWIFSRFLIWNHSEFCNLHSVASEMNLGTCVDFLKFVLNYTAAFEKLGPLWCTSVLLFT